MRFAIVVLTSTRQHFNLLDVDKISIQDTLNKSSIIRNGYKLCHIKVCNGDNEIFEDKKKWFESRGFEVISTIGDWKNDDESHGKGLTEDMAKVYSHPKLLEYDYVFNVENDWYFETNKLDIIISNSCDILKNNPQLIYIRSTRSDQLDVIERLNAVPKDDYYLVDREFSFNPFISRPRDMKYISNFVLGNYPIHGHVEKSYEICAKYLNNNNYIFAFFNNNIVTHLGWVKNYNEFVSKYGRIYI